MKYEASQNLSATEFKRLFGVRRETFAQMTELMQQAAQSKGQGGVIKCQGFCRDATE
jgi:hypothetical protein